jgi:hypothetical protein
VLLGWALANEPLHARTLLAATVIVASVALITSYGKREAANLDEGVDSREHEKDSSGDISSAEPSAAPDFDDEQLAEASALNASDSEERKLVEA